MNARLLCLVIAPLVSASRASAQVQMDLPKLGVQFSMDHWKNYPGAAEVHGGPGFGIRYEGQGLAPVTGGVIRAYSSLDMFYLGGASGGHALVSDFTLAMSAVAQLRSGLTPYAGGGLGFVFGGSAAGVSPIASAGVQFNRSGRIPYVDLTYYTRNSRRFVASVGFFR